MTLKKSEKVGWNNFKKKLEGANDKSEEEMWIKTKNLNN